MNIMEAGEVLAVASATGGICYAAFSKVIKPMHQQFKKQMDHLSAIPNLANDVTWMKDQIKPNGGSSLRDVVDRIAITQVIQSQVINNALASGSVGHFQANRDGLITQVSRTLCRIMNRSEQELMGNTWLSWIIDEDRNRIQAEWLDVVKLGREMDQDFRIWSDEGHVERIHMKAMQLRGPERQLLGYLGIVTIINDAVS